MADYLLLYRNGDREWAKRSPERIQEVMAQWGAWFKALEAGGNLRNPGNALAPGGAVVRKQGNGFTTDMTLSEVKELVGGYTLVQAGSLEEATMLAQGSPFLQNNPDGDIVVQPVAVMDG